MDTYCYRKLTMFLTLDNLLSSERCQRTPFADRARDRDTSTFAPQNHSYMVKAIFRYNLCTIKK